MHKLDDQFPEYTYFGRSAMTERVASGMLTGRPFGGVVILIHNRLRNVVQTIHCHDRVSIVKVSNYLIASVYLPCSGTVDRLSIYEELLAEISSYRDRYNDCELIIAGDFNVDLNDSNDVSGCVNAFINECNLHRCDKLCSSTVTSTYVNTAMGHSSYIDYALVSCADDLHSFTVLDPDLNFSDHLPLMVIIKCEKISVKESNNATCVNHLRWDKADKAAYYEYTGQRLSFLLEYVSHIDVQSCSISQDLINEVYDQTVTVLNDGAGLFVPACRTNSTNFGGTRPLIY